MSLHPAHILPFLALACAVGFPFRAPAATFYRGETATSAETCQAALPAYDGNIRKRPMALVNEGTSSAFVTCAFSVTDSSVFTERLDLYLVNTGSTYKTVSCTLVDGPQGSALPRRNAVRALAVAPGGALQAITWIKTDPDLQVADGFRGFALSCLLEPGTGIALSDRLYQETY